MIQSSFRPNQSVCFKVLSDDAIHEIKRAAFDVLEKTGCKIMHGGARKMLKSAGAIVRDDIVKIPEYIVKTALATAPNGVTIYDRQGRRAMELQGTNSHYGTSTASPNTRDATTGEIHETRVVDIARGALVADALSNIDWVMPMGSSQDVPAIAADVHEFEAVVTNTVKPMVFIGYSPRGNELVYEMAAAVAGGADRLREKPFLISYPEPITPLVDRIRSMHLELEVSSVLVMGGSGDYFEVADRVIKMENFLPQEVTATAFAAQTRGANSHPATAFLALAGADQERQAACVTHA